ncbi:hypothetical protein FPQ18DRAFT_393328 [Pyronema domesticum]|nr:hypothetical protein FPQ18DRAFT_393328 [Pyronema domesticum]
MSIFGTARSVHGSRVPAMRSTGYRFPILWGFKIRHKRESMVSRIRPQYGYHGFELRFSTEIARHASRGFRVSYHRVLFSRVPKVPITSPNLVIFIIIIISLYSKYAL